MESHLIHQILKNVGFSEEQISLILPRGALRSYAPGELILREGNTHQELRVLISGRVRVSSKGETIVELDQPGDLLGEMSLITGEPTSASIQTLSPVDLWALQMDSETLLQVMPVFAKVLARKLRATSQKARLFERTSLELAEVRSELQALHQERARSFAQEEEQLTELLKKGLGSESGAGASPVLQELLQSLKRRQVLKEALRGRRVCVLGNSEVDLSLFSLTLGGAGVEVSTEWDSNCQECWISEERLEETLRDLSVLQTAPPTLIAYTSGEASKQVEILERFPQLRTVLSLHPEDRSYNIRSVQSTLRAVSTETPLEVEDYLLPGTHLEERKVSSSRDRQSLIDEMNDYFKSKGVKSGLLRRVQLIAEELLMNAIYDAPQTPNGFGKYNHLSREDEVNLLPSEISELRYGTDGGFLAISVSDPFGALTRATLLSYAKRRFTEDQNGGDGLAVFQEHEGKGGGGYGLYQMMKSASLLTFSVLPKKRTTSLALINLNIQALKQPTHPCFQYFSFSDSTLEP